MQSGYGVGQSININDGTYNEWGILTFLTEAQKDARRKEFGIQLQKANEGMAKWKGGARGR